MKGDFNIVKAQVWAYLCKRVDLARLKTHGILMVGPLSFHSRKCWLSGIVNYSNIPNDDIGKIMAWLCDFINSFQFTYIFL